MIVGVGIDHVEIGRFAAFLRRRPERAVRRLFTPGERACCASRVNAEECYAARFAAKEAFLKAVGTGLTQGICWQEVEVVARDGGPPAFRLTGVALERMRAIDGERAYVSFSHHGGIAVAMAIIERDG